MKLKITELPYDYTIRFENAEMARAFFDWMSNSGEQDFWNACEMQGIPTGPVEYPIHHSTNKSIAMIFKEGD
jgi:nitroreductase